MFASKKFDFQNMLVLLNNVRYCYPSLLNNELKFGLLLLHNIKYSMNSTIGYSDCAKAEQKR